MLAAKHKKPEDLAVVVARELKKRRHQALPMPVLNELFDTLYFASLETEESQQAACYIVYMDPSNPDPKPPERTVKDRWNYVSLNDSIPFTTGSLVKISRASDPRTSSFAVYHNDKGKLFIWGLIDQGNRYHEFINLDIGAGPERPGLFQAAILGVGHLVAHCGYDRIAELQVDRLIQESRDVLRLGPVSDLIKSGIDRFAASVEKELHLSIEEFEPRWPSNLHDDWIRTLCRLLLRMRNFRHGGALLFTPDTASEGLSIKYRLQYDRIRTALQHIAIHRHELGVADNEIYEIMEARDEEAIPVLTYIESSIAGDELHDSSSELDGAIWFVSLLSRVDGLVLLTFDLEVKGFGVEILKQTPPPSVFRSTTASAKRAGLRTADYHSLGTRHRSMMRYCYEVPGSLGFVVSQDGDIRAMTRVGDTLVFWDGIRLQFDEFIGQKRAFRSGRARTTRNAQQSVAADSRNASPPRTR